MRGGVNRMGEGINRMGKGINMTRATLCALIFAAGLAAAQTANSTGAPVDRKTATAEAVRDYVLGYTKTLPNYTCTLTTRHTRTPIAVGDTRVQVTKVEEQLDFVDGKEVRRVTRIDGRPASDEDLDQQTDKTEGEFGALLYAIFAPKNGAQLRWDRTATLNKSKVDMISFRVPQPSGYVLNSSSGSVRVPFEGFVYADPQTHAVLRLQLKGTMIPIKFPMQEFQITLDYKAIKVAGHEVVLPSHFQVRYRDLGEDRDHNDDGQYSAYLQFGVDSESRSPAENQ